MFAYMQEHSTFPQKVEFSATVSSLSAPSAVTVVEGPALPAVIIDHT